MSRLQTTGKEPDTSHLSQSFSSFGWLGAFAIIGVLFLLLALPFMQVARGPDRSVHCLNNLSQIAKALLLYHHDHGAFPPAYTVDAEGKPLHSWRTLLLPYVDRMDVYEKVDLSKPWDDPANAVVRGTIVDIYSCFSAENDRTHTTYLASVGPSSLFDSTRTRSLKDITDRPSLTMMVIEVDSSRAVHWMSPHDASEQTILNLGFSKKLPHHDGFNIACADASTMHLDKRTKAETLRALLTIAGDDDAIAEKLE